MLGGAVIYFLLFALQLSKDALVVRGPKIHSTPDDLGALDGPGFKFVLNKNDHRWTATFKKLASPSVHWVNEYRQASMSRSFSASSEDWVLKLKEVHKWAWEKWSVADDLPQLRLAPGASAQVPGQIDEALIERLRPVIATLPEKTLYHSKK